MGVNSHPTLRPEKFTRHRRADSLIEKETLDCGFGISDLGLMKGMLPILFLDYQLSLSVP